jgi:hypothetical protein
MRIQPGVDYLSSIQVAARYGVAYQTVYQWIRKELLPGTIDRGPKTRPRFLIPDVALEGFEPPSLREGGGGWPAGRKKTDN